MIRMTLVTHVLQYSYDLDMVVRKGDVNTHPVKALNWALESMRLSQSHNKRHKGS